MTHDSSEGSLGTRANALGIPWLGLAENVAAGDDLDPVGAIDLWLHSPHHYANMRLSSEIIY
ncbi:hypothetical protein EV175_005397 [Coemansia sp. RSA 1933]|nr:hypothetical protein EV175_005397 [Coemansia sp. RSA 1933]